MRTITSGLLALTTLAAAALAQSGGSFELTSSTIDGGGTTFAVGGGFRLGSTIGQADAGQSIGGTFSLSGGLWDGLCGGDIASYGAGTAGTGGFVPVIDAVGCPTIGDTISIVTSNALGGTRGLIAIGLGPAAIPLFGGTLLTFPIATTRPSFLGGALNVPGAGFGTLAVPISNNPIFVGSTFYFQAGYFDPGAPGGFSFSNGVAVTNG